MANTYVDYTATAAQTDFAFSFDYLEDEHVTVEIDGVVQLTSDYSIVTSPSTKVVLNVGATAGQIVRVRRKSQPDTNLVDFVNGSVLTESELDRAYLHNRYLAEEIAELNDASLQLEQGGTQWDAKSLRIKNVDTPTAGTDATNKTYVDTNDALKVAKAGDSMTGELAMGGNKVTGLGTPTATTDASTKDYVDSKVNQVSSGASSPPTKWVFTGTAGANTTYDVTGAEVNGDTAYDVSIDGAVKEPTTDYTVDPDTDTLTIVPTLSGGEDIVVIERGFGVAVTSTIGSSQIQAGSITADKLATDAVTTAKIEDNAVTAAKISATDTNFNVQSSGRVGIGTTVLDSKLSIDGASTGTNLLATNPEASIKIRNSSDTDGNFASLDFYNSANFITARVGANFIDAGNRDTALYFATRENGGVLTQHMTIDEGGNVGIGTTTPFYALDITGDVNITGDYKINGASAITVPTGTVSAFAGSSAPTGYVLCDGSEYDEVAYAALFAVLGSTYNTGTETANHFRVPDLRGRVIAGTGGSLLSGSDALADTGGAKEHTLSIDEMPAHDHGGANSQVSDPSGTALTIGGTGSFSFVSLPSEGGGQPHNNVQPTIILNYIIKI